MTIAHVNWGHTYLTMSIISALIISACLVYWPCSVPGVTVATDIICGFPTETPEVAVTTVIHVCKCTVHGLG